MVVIVLATASRTGGALTIYKQFLSHLEKEKGTDKYYIFVNHTMPKPPLVNVEYIDVDTTSGIDRMKFDFGGFKGFLKEKEIRPEVVVSLQNTGLYQKDWPQLIYYHQPLPLYHNTWSPLRPDERILLYYKYLYPFFVKWTHNSKTQYVVQIPFMKKGLIKNFGFKENSIHVLFPDIEQINIDLIEPYEWHDKRTHFIYPANYAKYKNQITIVKALTEIPVEIGICIHLTLKRKDNIEIDKIVDANGLEERVVYEGNMPHEKLLSMYKSSAGLLFPSTIETLGLPLLEAAAFGLPILASDMDYAHQVIGNYKGVKFVPPCNPGEWANEMKNMARKYQRFAPIEFQESSWPKFFELVRNIAKQ